MVHQGLNLAALLCSKWDVELVDRVWRVVFTYVAVGDSCKGDSVGRHCRSPIRQRSVTRVPLVPVTYAHSKATIASIIHSVDNDSVTNPWLSSLRTVPHLDAPTASLFHWHAESKRASSPPTHPPCV